MSFSFKEFSKKDLSALTSKRDGELKIGQNLVSLKDADFVVIGIRESIGPQANLGNAGSENAFRPFLGSFLNMQWNRFTEGLKICILGEVISNIPDAADVHDKRLYVDRLDTFVYKILQQHLSLNQTPVVIGGGHNNAYPIMKYCFGQFGKLNIINLDPHADYRQLEGRHSGNPFSYAFHDGFITKYHVLGLHKYYNSESILMRLKEDGHFCSFFDDWLDKIHSLEDELSSVVMNCKDFKNRIGLELDLDSISFMPVSAFTPSGITVEQARSYIRQVSRSLDTAYLHIPEGAPHNTKEQKIVGKTLAYLVLDFITQKNALE
jgi:formiminoglutamase